MAQVEATVTDALGHLSGPVTRLEIHLSDQNCSGSGQLKKRCTIEARLEGRRPTAVTCDAESVNEAVAGASDMLRRLLERGRGRRRNRHG